MRTMIVIAATLMLAGCSPGNFPTSTDTREKVNTTVELILRDTLYALRLPPERDRNSVPQDDSSYLETSAAWSRAWVTDGRLHHELGNKSREPLLIPVRIPERRITVDSTHAELVRIPVHVEKKLSWWQQTVMGAGYISLCTLIVFVAIKILRKKLL